MDVMGIHLHALEVLLLTLSAFRFLGGMTRTCTQLQSMRLTSSESLCLSIKLPTQDTFIALALPYIARSMISAPKSVFKRCARK
jgi:hypothetical protein